MRELSDMGKDGGKKMCRVCNVGWVVERNAICEKQCVRSRPLRGLSTLGLHATVCRGLQCLTVKFPPRVMLLPITVEHSTFKV